MVNSKLIKLLKSLSEAEFKGLQVFVQSPAYNTNTNVLRLYRALKKYFPDFESPKLEKEKIFKKLFPNQAFSDVKLRQLRSKLSKIIEEYLIYLEFQKDEFRKKKLLTEIYGKRNLYVEFKRGTENLLWELEKQPYRDAEYFYDRYLLQRDFFLFGLPPKEGRSGFYLNNAIKALTEFNSIEQLRLLLYKKNLAVIYSNEH